ncbi:hypothetical protein Tco_1335039 [Tanacetum coccineum]
MECSRGGEGGRLRFLSGRNTVNGGGYKFGKVTAHTNHSEIVVDSNDDSTSSDDDSPYGEDIDYVDASPPDSELVSLEVVEIVIPEVGGIDTDILLTIKTIFYVK